MSFLLKLIRRDLWRNRSQIFFSVAAIAATSCLVVWFVGQVDTKMFAKDNGTKKFFGSYSLALSFARPLQMDVAEVIEYLSSVERTGYAYMGSPSVRLVGFDAALAPTGMGDRRSPVLIGMGDAESPFGLAEGRWVADDTECVVSTAAEKLLTAAPGKTSRRRIRLGDEIEAVQNDVTNRFKVVGKIRMSVPENRPQQKPQTFAWGFGVGLGGRGMGTGGASADKRPAGQPQTGGPGGPGGPGGARRGPRMFGARPADPVSPVVFTTLGGAQGVCGAQGVVNLMYVKLDKENAESAFYADLEKNLQAPMDRLGITPFDSRPQAAAMESMAGPGGAKKSLLGQAGPTVGLVLLASVFIIFTTLSMGLSQKVRALSTLRAIGFTRGQVGAFILVEGLVLGLLGGVLGLALGLGLLALPDYVKTGVMPEVSLGAGGGVLAVAGALAGSLLASIVPAVRATRVAPAEAMVRRAVPADGKKLFRSGLLGAVLLAVLPAIVFLLPAPNRTKLLLFSTVGTLCLGLGFFFFTSWALIFSERVIGPVLARLFGFHPGFLARTLTSNRARTFGTVLSMSVGLGLFTAIHIWSGSMLTMFDVPKTIPDVLVRVHEGIASPETSAKVAAWPNLRPNHLLPVSVAQPALDLGMQATLPEHGGAMAGNFVVMGLDAGTAWRDDDPLLRLRFVEGDAASVRAAFAEPDSRACVIPETVSVNAGLHVGDTFRLAKSDVRPKERRGGPGGPGGQPDAFQLGVEPEYAEYKVAGVVDFAWIWFSKCSGVRVSAGRTAGLIFAPYEAPVRDFGAPADEFFWFDTKPGVLFETMQAEFRALAKAEADKVPGIERQEAYSGGTLWSSGINKNFVSLSSNESLNNSLFSRADSVIDSMARMPLVVLVLAVLAVINTMVVSVRNRRWELGVLRACGVTRGGLVRIVLAEAVLIGLSACVLSFAFGVFYSWLADKMVEAAPMFGCIAPPLVVPWAKLLPGYALAVCLAAAAGVVPALRAGLAETSSLLQRPE